MPVLSIVVSALLAAIFLGAALPKIALAAGPVRQLGRIGVPPILVRAAGLTELAGAIGLVVGIWVPWLGALAAGLLGLQMLLAAGWHLAKHDDAPHTLPSLVLLVLSAVALVLRLSAAG